MNQHERPTAYEDEINLYDYWKVIAKKEWLIVGILLISVITAGIISLRMPKIYMVMTILEIGKALSLIEDPNHLKVKIDIIYPFNTISRLNIPEDEMPDTKAEIIQDTSLINVTIKSPKPEFALKILYDINKQIAEEHGSLISNYKIDMGNKMKNLSLQINILKKEKETVFSKIKINEKNKAELRGQIQRIDYRIQKILEETNRLNLQTNPNNVLSSFLFNNEIQLSQRYCNELEDRLNISLPKEELEIRIGLERIEKSIKDTAREEEALQNQINTIRETKVLISPSYSKTPIKPNIKKNMAIAGITSLFAGIFLAFFVEYVAKMRFRQ